MFKRAAIPLFSALAIIHTWPMLPRAASSVIDDGDGLLNTWLLAAVSHRLITHPLELFDINMYYPYRGALATLDHQLSAVLLAAPIALLTGNPALAANLFTIATFALSGMFTAMLVRELTGSVAAGLIGGCAYAFSGMRLENIHHTHVLGNYWLPLALLSLHRYILEPSWGRLWLTVAVSLLLAFATWNYAVIGPIALLIVGCAETARRRTNVWLIGRRALVGGVVALLVLGATALPYVRITHEYLPRNPRATNVPASSGDLGPQPSIDRTMRQDYSAPVQSYFGVAALSRAPWTKPLRGVGRDGARFFPGVVAAIFAALAIADVVRRQTRASPLAWIPIAMTGIAGVATGAAALGHAESTVITVTRVPGFFLVLLVAFAAWPFLRPMDPLSRERWIPAPRTYLVLAVVGAVLSLGAQVVAFKIPIGDGVYPATMPPFSLLRTSARFGTMYLMGVAVLAGFGYAAIAQRLRRHWMRQAVLGAALILMNVELFGAPIHMTRLGRVPAAYEWLKTAPAGPVIEFPTHGNIRALYWSLFHGHPIANGYGLVEPAAFARLKDGDDLSPAMVEHLRAYVHPRYIVVNTAAYRGERGKVLTVNLARDTEQLHHRGDFAERRIFEVGGPSRGTIVVRSYQPWMVEWKRGIAVRARLDATVIRGVPVLQVWGNGHLLASAGPDQLRRGDILFAPMPPDITRGLDVEVMADYTLPAGTGATLGRTGWRVPADIALTVDPQRTRIQVNGHVWIGEKGYTIVTIDPDGRVRDVRAFNTSWSEAESHAFAAHVASVPAGRTVAIASSYDAARSLTADAVRAIATLGMATDLRGHFRWAHAGVGIKGARPGTAVESFGPKTAECRIGTAARIPIVVDEVRIY